MTVQSEQNRELYYLRMNLRSEKINNMFNIFHCINFRQHLTYNMRGAWQIMKNIIFKVFARSVVFSAFYADFCLCPKSVIITTLTHFNAFNSQNKFLFGTITVYFRKINKFKSQRDPSRAEITFKK